jgi:hypothetical protein
MLEIMSNEPAQIETDPSKPIRRQYGPICPHCKQVIPIAADDIAPNVDISTFREKLRRDGYRVHPATCLYRGCGHTINAKLHLVNFGVRDDTLPTEETF